MRRPSEEEQEIQKPAAGVASAGLPVVYASVPSLREFLGNTATIVVSTKRSAPTSDPLAQPYRNVSSTIAMAEGVVFALLKKQGLLEQPKYLPKRAIRFLIGEGIHYLSDPASLAEFSQQPGCSPFKFPREDGKICFTQQEEIVQFFGTLKSLWVFMQDPARVAASKRAEAEYVKKTVALLKQVEEEQPSLAGMFEIVTTHELAEKSGIGRLIEKSVGSEQGQPSAWMDELESAALQVNKAGVYAFANTLARQAVHYVERHLPKVAEAVKPAEGLNQDAVDLQTVASALTLGFERALTRWMAEQERPDAPIFYDAPFESEGYFRSTVNSLAAMLQCSRLLVCGLSNDENLKKFRQKGSVVGSSQGLKIKAFTPGRVFVGEISDVSSPPSSPPSPSSPPAGPTGIDDLSHLTSADKIMKIILVSISMGVACKLVDNSRQIVRLFFPKGDDYSEEQKLQLLNSPDLKPFIALRCDVEVAIDGRSDLGYSFVTDANNLRKIVDGFLNKGARKSPDSTPPASKRGCSPARPAASSREESGARPSGVPSGYAENPYRIGGVVRPAIVPPAPGEPAVRPAPYSPTTGVH